MRIATPESEAAAAKAVQDLQIHGFQKLVNKKTKASSHTEFSVLSREWYQQTLLPVTRLSLIPHTGTPAGYISSERIVLPWEVSHCE